MFNISQDVVRTTYLHKVAHDLLHIVLRHGKVGSNSPPQPRYAEIYDTHFFCFVLSQNFLILRLCARLNALPFETKPSIASFNSLYFSAGRLCMMFRKFFIALNHIAPLDRLSLTDAVSVVASERNTLVAIDIVYVVAHEHNESLLIHD